MSQSDCIKHSVAKNAITSFGTNSHIQVAEKQRKFGIPSFKMWPDWRLVCMQYSAAN